MNDLKRKKRISDGIRKQRIVKKRKKKPFVLYKEKKPELIKINQEPIKKNRLSKEKKRINYREVSKLKRFLRSFIGFFIFHRKKIKWILYIVIYSILIFFIINKMENTKVKIFPKKKNISISEKINVYSNPKFKELGFSIIAISEILTKKIEADEEVSFSEKAKGIITIFNDYSTEPQKLSPETRFQSISGKIFKLSNKSIIIPGKTKQGPGKIKVEVYAEKAGPEYNIDITDFTIPGFKEAGLQDKFNKIYALSTEKFSGGFNGKKKRVSSDLKEKTVKSLEDELKKLLIKKLEIEKTDKVILVDKSIEIIFKQPEIDKSHENYFQLKQKAQIFALIIEKKKLGKWLKSKYLENSFGQDIQIGSFDKVSFEYDGDSIDFYNLKEINLKINALVEFIWEVDNKLFLESIVGLSKKDVVYILKEFDEIDRAEIYIFPFWKKNLSSHINHIKIIN